MTRCEKFRRLLAIEIEGLEEELRLWIKRLDHRLENAEITEYVRLENSALLRSELMGLEFLLNGCTDISLDDDESVDELTQDIKKHFRQRLQERGYPPALYLLVEQKIDKVGEYLKLDTPAAPADGGEARASRSERARA